MDNRVSITQPVITECFSVVDKYDSKVEPIKYLNKEINCVNNVNCVNSVNCDNAFDLLVTSKSKECKGLLLENKENKEGNSITMNGLNELKTDIREESLEGNRKDSEKIESLEINTYQNNLIKDISFDKGGNNNIGKVKEIINFKENRKSQKNQKNRKTIRSKSNKVNNMNNKNIQNNDKNITKFTITTINISTILKERLQYCCENYEIFTFIEEKLENIKDVQYIIIKKSSLGNIKTDFKLLYSLSFQDKIFIDLKFIEDSFNAKQWKKIEYYKIISNNLLFINTNSISNINKVKIIDKRFYLNNKSEDKGKVEDKDKDKSEDKVEGLALDNYKISLYDNIINNLYGERVMDLNKCNYIITDTKLIFENYINNDNNVNKDSKDNNEKIQLNSDYLIDSFLNNKWVDKDKTCYFPKSMT